MSESIGLRIGDLQGVWCRTLIVWPDGERDTTSWVTWLQGPTLYVDLRQPPLRPVFRNCACLRQLEPAQLLWLAGQQGFAGRLHEDGDFFLWRRLIDFQPEALQPDSGTLRLEGGILVEEGRHTPYIEQWRRDGRPSTPCGALYMRDRSHGCDGVIVRCAGIFMCARGRPNALPPGVSLISCVEGAASLDEAQDLIDCEVSFGRAGPGAWIIERSSLPFKEGFALDLALNHDRCRSADLSPHGRPIVREWDIFDGEGDAAAFQIP